MFRRNTDHLQSSFFDTTEALPEKVRQRLAESWADSFYRNVFCRIDEERFAVLYSDEASRPNTPVNRLLGLEMLKAGFGWTDEEMYERFQFDLLVRYALGLRTFSDGHFELRTVYNFRQRLSEHMQTTGENLLEGLFEQITDEQLAALEVNTEIQRMDSTLVASNIRRMSRLQLLVEVLQRVWRMLDDEDQTTYADAFDSYVGGTAGQYCYRLSADEVPEHLEQIGILMHELLDELASDYADDPSYALLQRVFTEHFEVATSDTEHDDDPPPPRAKSEDELDADSLQSPDDWEATYRQKGDEQAWGYVANVVETCHPDNEVQLITQLDGAAPNVTDDTDLLLEGLPSLTARTDLETLWTDGGYISTDATEALKAEDVTQVPTAIRGRSPDPGRVGLDAFTWELDAAGVPAQVTCPEQQQVALRPGRVADRYLADFDIDICASCPLADRCPTEPLTRRPVRVLRVDHRAIQVAILRQRSAHTHGPGNNLRAAIESSVRSLKHPITGPTGKLPVRGQIRATMLLFCSAFMVNLRRMWRYEQEYGPVFSTPSVLMAPFSLLLTYMRRVESHFSHWYEPRTLAGVL